MEHGGFFLRETVKQNSGSSEFCTCTGPHPDGIWRLYGPFRQPDNSVSSISQQENPAGSWLSICTHFLVTGHHRQLPAFLLCILLSDIYIYSWAFLSFWYMVPESESCLNFNQITKHSGWLYSPPLFIAINK